MLTWVLLLIPSGVAQSRKVTSWPGFLLYLSSSSSMSLNACPDLNLLDQSPNTLCAPWTGASTYQEQLFVWFQTSAHGWSSALGLVVSLWTLNLGSEPNSNVCFSVCVCGWGVGGRSYPLKQQTTLHTPAGCPTIQLNVDTIHPEIASDSTR